MSSHETMTKRAKLHRCPFDMLNAEILAKALGYLAWKDALKSRACVKLKDAAKDAFACSDDDDAIRVNVEDDRSYQLLESIARSGSIDVKFLFISNDESVRCNVGGGFPKRRGTSSQLPPAADRRAG